jgi:hypothetical protein
MIFIYKFSFPLWIRIWNEFKSIWGDMYRTLSKKEIQLVQTKDLTKEKTHGLENQDVN